MKESGEENEVGNELINDNIKFVQCVLRTCESASREQKHSYGKTPVKTKTACGHTTV